MRVHADWSQELLLIKIGLIITHRYSHVACKFALLANALLINEVFPILISLICFFFHDLRKINCWRS